MKFSLFMALFIGMTTTVAHSAVGVSELRATFETSASAVKTTLSEMQRACGAVSKQLSELRTLAGVGVGVSAVGTVAASVATGVGIKKSELDAVAMNKNIFKEKWEELKNKFDASDAKIDWKTPASDAVDAFIESIAKMNPDDDLDVDLSEGDMELQKARQDSKMGQKAHTLGDVRTGTLAAGTVTNVVGAAVSGANVANKDLKGHVNECIDVAGKMKRAVMQARMDRDAYNNALKTQKNANQNETVDAIMSNRYMDGIDNAIRACEEWSTIDLSKIGKRAGGALATGIIGATTGMAGTIASAMANAKDVHLSGVDKEKKLNTTANVLSGTTAAASGVATILSVAQISAIKKAASVDDKCMGALDIK